MVTVPLAGAVYVVDVHPAVLLHMSFSATTVPGTTAGLVAVYHLVVLRVGLTAVHCLSASSTMFVSRRYVAGNI